MGQQSPAPQARPCLEEILPAYSRMIMPDDGDGVGPRYTYLPNQGSCQGPEGVKSRSLHVWVSGFKFSGL